MSTDASRYAQVLSRDGRAVLWPMGMEPPPVDERLHHEPDAEGEAGETCTPRVLATCSVCHRELVYCHLTAASLLLLVRQWWRCADCAVSHD